MNAQSIIEKFNRLGITLSVEDGKITFYAEETLLKDELIAELTANKQNILTFLQQTSTETAFKEKRFPAMQPIKRIDGDGRPIASFPMSFAQERLWFIDQISDSSDYNIARAVSIHSEVNIDHLNQAFNLIISRHESLRTIFPVKDGIARQVVLEQLDFAISCLDLNHVEDQIHDNQSSPQSSPQEIANAICQREAETPFDLATGPLLRVTLVTLSEQEHILLLTMHHIISDGWSIGVMLRDLNHILACLREGQSPELSPLPIQYVDYSHWQKKRLEENGLLEQQLKYWQQKLEGVPAFLDLKTDYPRPAVQTAAGAKHYFSLDADITRQLQTLSNQQGGTLFMTLLAVFSALLCRYTGQTDICLGSPIANRQNQETEGLMGMFVNTLALRNQIDPDASFLTLLSQVQNTCLEAYQHQDAPFEKIVERIQPERNTAISPIFQIMFVLQESPAQLFGENIKPYPLKNDTSKFDLSLELMVTEQGLEGFFEFRTSLFHAQRIEGMVRHFNALCQSVIAMPNAKIRELDLLDGAEKQQLLYGYNQTQFPFPNNKCLHELCMQPLAVSPDKPTVICDNDILTRQQLLDQSHTLAMYLQSIGTGPDAKIALLMDRSTDMVVSMSGVMLSGAAYVPLDPNYPNDRLAFMIQDCQPMLILTQKRYLKKLPVKMPVIAVDGQWSEISDKVATLKANQVTLTQQVKPNHLAYILYTSGSTGQPKGVMVEHKSAVNAVTWFCRHFTIRGSSQIILLTDYTFDPSVEDIFAALMTGATLYIPSKDVLMDQAKLASYLAENRITGINCVPAFLDALLLHPNKLDSIEYVISGGDSLSESLKNEILSRGYNLHNNYGPTEATIDTLSAKCDENQVVIGTPISNTQVYILDQHRQPVPDGVPGELFIAGDGLARGYLNRPELTNEMFIPNPFIPDSRMYKSGDMVCRRHDDNIEYLGRSDTQVKIRGFRIETGEIEAQMLAHPNVKECVVVPQKHNEVLQGQSSNRMLAFYVCDASMDDPKTDLHSFLSHSLPSHMVPAVFTRLKSIPLTSNGKVDRRQLETWDIAPTAPETYIAPRNETEQTLQAIWADLLRLTPEKISTNSNFFELGGHSLLLTRLVSKIRVQLNVELSITRLFELPTITAMADFIAEDPSPHNGLTQQNAITKIPRHSPSSEPLPLSFSQERLWFMEQLAPGNVGYTIAGAILIRGDLKAEHLDQALNRIISRHESLRTRFPDHNGQAKQVILDSMTFKLEQSDLSHITNDIARYKMAKAQCQQTAETPFDLSKGPLIRGKLLTLDQHEKLLLLTMHHIVSDGWSMGVLFEELGVILNSLQQGREPNLPLLPIQYSDYSVWQRQRTLENNQKVENGLIQKQLNYWQEKLRDVPESLDLHSDYPRPAKQCFSGAKRAFQLDQKLSERLQKLAKQQGTSLFMLLLAAFKTLLYRYTDQQDICIGTPIANRQYQETENLIGMFVNLLPLRNQIEPHSSFLSFLSQVKATCLEAYEHQEAPFEKIVDLVKPNRSTAIDPIFQLLLVLQNTLGEPRNTLSVNSKNLQITPFPLDSQTSKFDITIEFAETDDGLKGAIEYRNTLYTADTIAGMARHFKVLCQAIVDAPDTKVSELQLMSEAEKQLSLTGYNQTQEHYPADKCLHQLCVEQLSSTPDKPAVICQNQILTCQQLLDKSNALALYLQSQSVTPDTTVALCLQRSTDMITCMLGVMRSGGAYVPMAPDQPDDRLAFMLKDCLPAVVLTQQSYRERLTRLVPDTTTVLAVDKDWADINNKAANSQVTVEQNVKPNHLAYIIYTSGSTGQPKGVTIEHKSAVNAVTWFCQHFNIGEQNRLFSLIDYTFDPSVEDIFGALISGATLHVPSTEQLQDPTQLATYIAQNKITGVKSVPGMLDALLCHAPKMASIEWVISGGEPLPEKVKSAILSKGYQLHNHYGPTEATITTLSKQCHDGEPIVIGTPVNNTQVYILDQQQQLVPVGVPGELCIAGDGLARGYLNRPDLTEKHFVPNPFEPGRRMYKSGDLVRRLHNGTIAYLGRVDTQVKIRGFRIEIGEIETRLQAHPGITDCAVVTQENATGKHLLAFYVAGSIESATDLNTFLSQSLPGRMIPSLFTRLDNIPLTRNGKVDRRALEAMDIDLSCTVSNSQNYVAPRNPTEQAMVEIWGTLLDIPPVNIGIHDNFFELGGHSLSALQLIARINQHFERSLSVATLFSSPTPAALAKQISSHQESAIEILAAIQTAGDAPPLFAVPGITGNVFSFQAMSEAFREQQPLYAFQTMGLNVNEAPLTSIKDIAALNIEAMKTVQPEGPYHLIGHSFGGSVAFEMVSILLQNNESVASLILLDAFAPATNKQASKDAKIDETHIMIEAFNALANVAQPDLSLTEEQLRSISKLNKDQCYEYAVNLLSQYGIEVTTQQFAAYCRVVKTNQQNFQAYFPERLSEHIEVCLVRACETSTTINKEHADSDYGWNALLTTPIQTFECPGDHFSMLHKENVPNLVEVIRHK